MKATKPKLKPTHPAEDAPHDPISGLLHATRTAAMEVAEATNIANHLSGCANGSFRSELFNIALMLSGVLRKMETVNKRVLAVRGAFAEGGAE